jgi:hypothetical protein
MRHLRQERKLRYTFRKLCVIEVTIEQVGSDVRLLDQAITVKGAKGVATEP